MESARLLEKGGRTSLRKELLVPQGLWIFSGWQMKKKQAEEARSAANREAAVAIAPKTFALIFFIGENPFQMGFIYRRFRQ